MNQCIGCKIYKNYGEFDYCCLTCRDSKGINHGQKCKKIQFISQTNNQPLIQTININNTVPIQKEVKIIKQIIVVKDKEPVQLDNLKVSGLKDLCVKHNLNTSLCSTRSDYVNLLIRNKIGV